MFIWTITEIKPFTTFGFQADDTTKNLEIGDLVYLWEKRSRLGLGDELIYGTGQIVAIKGKNLPDGKQKAEWFTVERIK